MRHRREIPFIAASIWVPFDISATRYDWAICREDIWRNRVEGPWFIYLISEGKCQFHAPAALLLNRIYEAKVSLQGVSSSQLQWLYTDISTASKQTNWNSSVNQIRIYKLLLCFGIVISSPTDTVNYITGSRCTVIKQWHVHQKTASVV
jgi:hypothetical protein